MSSHIFGRSTGFSTDLYRRVSVKNFTKYWRGVIFSIFYGKPHAFCGENRVSEGLRWLSWSSQGPLRYEETSKKS